MEELFSKLALYAVTTVGKAAFGMAVSKAVSNLAKSPVRIKSEPSSSSDDSLQKEKAASQKRFLELRSRLEQKIAILSPSIDMIQLVAAKSNSPGLEAVLGMAQELNDAFVMLGTWEDLEDTQALCVEVDTLLRRMEEMVPYMHLALSISGVHLGTSVAMSLSVVLNAARWTQRINDILFPCRLYTLFEGNVRSHAPAWTWKLEMLSAHVSLKRHAADATCGGSSSSSSAFEVYMHVTEAFEDQGVHEEPPLHHVYPVSELHAYFFALAGQLLNIVEATQPVLVLKFGTTFIALEIMEKPSQQSEADEQDDEESEEEQENNAVKEKKGNEARDLRAEKTLEKGDPHSSPTQTVLRSYQLVLLDAMLRIVAMEWSLQKPYWEVPDETLMAYLSNDEPPKNKKSSTMPYASPMPLHNFSQAKPSTKTRSHRKSSV